MDYDLNESSTPNDTDTSFPSWEGRVAVFLLAVQVCLVALGVISRHFSVYLFGKSLSLSFTEELSRYLLAWVTAFGLCAVFAEEGLLSLRIWPDRPGTFRAIRRWIGLLATVGLAILIAVQGLRVIELHWETDKRTGVMGWPMIWVTISLPLGMFLICARAIPCKISNTGKTQTKNAIAGFLSRNRS